LSASCPGARSRASANTKLRKNGTKDIFVWTAKSVESAEVSIVEHEVNSVVRVVVQADDVWMAHLSHRSNFALQLRDAGLETTQLLQAQTDLKQQHRDRLSRMSRGRMQMYSFTRLRGFATSSSSLSIRRISAAARNIDELRP
jgi:hypothetical protein